MYVSDYCSSDMPKNLNQMLLSRKDRQNLIQEKLHNNQHDDIVHVKLNDNIYNFPII